MSWSMESVREAELTPAEVFSFYLDPSTWGSWAHNTRGAHADGPVEEGAIVHVDAGYRKTWAVLVRRIEPDRLIETEVHPPGLDLVQRFELEPTGSGVLIRHRIEVSGWAAGFTGITLRPLYVRLLAKETARLVELAEHRRSVGAATAG